MLTPNAIHPTNRTLLAYLDCELPVDERHHVAAHLRDCPGCRAELDGIEADLDWYLVLDAASLPSQAPPRPEGMQRLLRSMRDWRQSNAATLAAAAEKQQQVGVAMEVYLGDAAGDGVAQNDRAEVLLSAFLGRRAASTLMKDLRGSSSIDRRLATDLT